MIRHTLPALFAIAFCASASVADETADLKKRLSATWTVTGLAVIGGNESSHGVVTWTFEGNTLILREDGNETARWGHTLTTGKEFPFIDFTVIRDGESCQPFLGVLDLNADTLTVVLLPVSATVADIPPFLRVVVAEAIDRNRSVVVMLRRKK